MRLKERTEHTCFESGILSEVFEMLCLKVQHMPHAEKICALTMDEFSIERALQGVVLNIEGLPFILASRFSQDSF